MYPYNYQNYNRYQPQTDIQFVNGRASAEVYVMPPSSRIILMDSNLARFYLKETDATGFAKITAYDFSEVVEPEPTSVEYITKQEFEEWKAKFNESFNQKQSGSTVSERIEF